MIWCVMIWALLYVIQMLFYLVGWWRVTSTKCFNLTVDTFNQTLLVSVIIPVRNDAEVLMKCLTTLTQYWDNDQHYEIIVVNDHSEDYIDICRQKFESEHISFVNLPAHMQGKKEALTYGISMANREIIATIDADVLPSKHWLSSMYSKLSNKHTQLVTGPVLLNEENGFLNGFQVLDNLGLMLITAGSIAMRQPLMANGANLLFKKEAFTKVDGYNHTKNYAGGDDTTLMQKIARQYGTDSISFGANINAAVYTQAQPTTSKMLMQRQRWAGKALGFIYKRTTALLAFNYLYAASIFATFIVMLFTGDYIPFTILLFTKLIMDGAVVGLSAIYFKQYTSLAWMPLCIIVHVPYVLWTGAMGILNPGKWKGRGLKG